MMRKMRPVVSLRGRDGGQDDALLGRRRRRRQQVVHAAAVHQRERRDVLRHAVFEDLEVVLRQVRHELVLAVADDGVHGDQVDVDAEGRLRALAPGAGAGAGWAAGAGLWALNTAADSASPANTPRRRR